MDARLAIPFAAPILAALLAGGTTSDASAQGASWSPTSGIIVHDSDETLRDRCERDAAGLLWLTLPNGARFELIESASDPAIANPGDGAFHPFDALQVRSALAQVRYPLEAVRAEVFLLPFPRRGGLESAAAPGLVLLSPGVWPLSVEQQHAECVHELGHVVQYLLMPDADALGWSQYRRLRHIEDETTFTAAGAHANRPHEIFAEDFRALFGGVTANYSGTIENSALAYPTTVTGLADFFLGLAEARFDGMPLRAAANPARAVVRFESGRLDAGTLDLVDVTGRRLATLEAVRVPGGLEWTWDRRDLGGARVGAGVVFARARHDGRAVVRVTLAP